MCSMNCASAPLVSSAAMMAIVFVCIVLLAFSSKISHIPSAIVSLVWHVIRNSAVHADHRGRHSAHMFSVVRGGEVSRYRLDLLIAEPYSHVSHKAIYEHVDYPRRRQLSKRFLGRRT